MFKQHGNFNGIDTCSVTQYRKFKLLSYLLQENEIRSLKGRADINALLTQIVHEKDLSLDMASKIRQIAENSPFDINKLSYGATYVPIDVAIDLGNDKLCDVVWDSGGAQLITPCFPTFIYPLQACNKYGCSPHFIPLFSSVGSNAKNMSMLWLLSGILLGVQEIWMYVYNIPLHQSK